MKKWVRVKKWFYTNAQCSRLLVHDGVKISLQRWQSYNGAETFFVLQDIVDTGTFIIIFLCVCVLLQFIVSGCDRGYLLSPHPVPGLFPQATTTHLTFTSSSSSSLSPSSSSSSSSFDRNCLIFFLWWWKYPIVDDVDKDDDDDDDN